MTPATALKRNRVLAVRLDGLGDVLLTGPALRALAAGSRHVTLLAGPAGAAVAPLLPGVNDVLVYNAPWIGPDPQPLDDGCLRFLMRELILGDFDEAVVFTSFHQSPLPAALLLRMTAVPRVCAISVDYPGSLLDVRHQVDEDIPEPERALSLARAAGFELPPGDDGRLALRRPLPDVSPLIPSEDYIAVHPGCTAPARTWPVERWAQTVRELTAEGHRVVVTGSKSERELTARVAGECGAVDLGGRTRLPELAAVLAAAAVTIAPNTGPAHLSAAVGTPVVSLFAPVVPAVRWAPYGVESVLLGDQGAACADTRARECPVPGHPCLSGVTARDVVGAVEKLLVRDGHREGGAA
jgi:ADP-heptose:LPS heptosyltransferase